MRVHVIAVGRIKAGPLAALQSLYAERITAPLAFHEIEERRKLPPPELKEREGELLLATLPLDAFVVALDRNGQALSSEALAARFAQWRQEADVAFIIGGAEGLSPAVLRRARFVWSFGPATWPHFLARGMLLEQLYRAQQILVGHPYHRA
ncbi:MAG: 23S rRNA (pseudouridine(1915)-N(3))-methyltransferase RlmH [Stellaceae bacterium]